MGASAAPAEQADERATAAQEQDRGQEQDQQQGQDREQQKNERAVAAQEQRTERQDDAATSEEWSEDNDTNDGGTPNNIADDGDNVHPSGKDRSVEHGRSGNQGNVQSDPDDDGRGPDRSNGDADEPNGAGGVDEADQDGNNGCGNDDDFEDDNEGLCLGRQAPDGGDAEPEGREQEQTEQEQTEQEQKEPSEELEASERNGVIVSTGEQTPTAAPASGVAGVRIVEREQREERVQLLERVERERPVQAPADVAIAEDVEAAVMGVTFASQPAEVRAATLGAVAPADEEQAAVAAQDVLPRTGAGLAGLAAMGLTSLAGGAALSRRRR